jgi:hypothetical protein
MDLSLDDLLSGLQEVQQKKSKVQDMELGEHQDKTPYRMQSNPLLISPSGYRPSSLSATLWSW